MYRYTLYYHYYYSFSPFFFCLSREFLSQSMSSTHNSTTLFLNLKEKLIQLWENLKFNFPLSTNTSQSPSHSLLFSVPWLSLLWPHSSMTSREGLACLWMLFEQQGTSWSARQRLSFAERGLDPNCQSPVEQPCLSLLTQFRHPCHSSHPCSDSLGWDKLSWEHKKAAHDTQALQSNLG